MLAEDEEPVHHGAFSKTNHNHRSTPMDKIHAWSVLRPNKVLMKEAVERRVHTVCQPVMTRILDNKK
jgi:hypothetical protein